ncbi:MAG: uracil-DNA glycosylase [Bacilli bacterium]|nr:uracil-DNA glycosylase [Bacilli bacterium]
MSNWQELLHDEIKKDYFQHLSDKIKKERLIKNIFPIEQDVFRALELTPIDKVRVVLLGQDPYHEVNQACGLAFSVPKNEKLPPSLRNIYKELSSDLGITAPLHGDLTNWAKDGVLLLNTVLTVEEGHAQSHHDYGWQIFTDKIISLVNLKTTPVVFILLGNDAKTKINLITNPIHKIITAAHPSPLSSYRGFFGSKIFSKTNEFLILNNLTPINWNSIND